MKKILKILVNTICIYLIIVNLIPVGERVVQTYENKQVYKKALEEKEERKEENEALKEVREYDWLTISETNIDYPIMWKENDNSYYLSHDMNGNKSIHGSIFYEGFYKPHESYVDVIYGHCMKDGTMFNNLHKFKRNEETFRKSELTIELKDGTIKRYKPLGLYVTNSNFFYTTLYKKEPLEGIKTIKENTLPVKAKYIPSNIKSG